jgi:hypothetical protein
MWLDNADHPTDEVEGREGASLRPLLLQLGYRGAGGEPGLADIAPSSLL